MKDDVDAPSARSGLPPSFNSIEDAEKVGRYSGIPAICDGSEAAAYVESHISEIALAYPITPSSMMPQYFQQAVADGKKNLWGTPLDFVQLESEHSAASGCEGAAAGGLRVASFTSSQGLVLMKEVLYPIAGKGLPVVFHIGARALTVQSLNIHAGHDDVMAVSDTGWGILFARNAQEVADLALIARKTAEDTQVPFMVVQDGFLTTHTMERGMLPEPELMKIYVGDPREKISLLMDTARPITSGVVQNQDSYMKGRVALRDIYARVKPVLYENMIQFTRLTKRVYGLVRHYNCQDANYVVIAMGTMAETAEEVADYLRSRRVKAGVLNITSFRPFPSEEIGYYLIGARAISVIERTDNPLAHSNPLTLEVKASLYDICAKKNRVPVVYSGIAGLGGRDVTREHILAAFRNMQRNEKRFFALDVPHSLSIAPSKEQIPRPSWQYSLRGHSVGGWGSVSTNKVLASLIGSLMPSIYVQAYPKYGSEKRGMPTSYFLTLSSSRILTHSEPSHIDMAAIHDVKAFYYANPLRGLVEGGSIFIQCGEDDIAEVMKSLPKSVFDMMRGLNYNVYACDVMKIAREVAGSSSLAVRLQGVTFVGCFIRIYPRLKQQIGDDERIFRAVEEALKKFFGKAGGEVIEKNMKCVRRGYAESVDVTGRFYGAKEKIRNR